MGQIPVDQFKHYTLGANITYTPSNNPSAIYNRALNYLFTKKWAYVAPEEAVAGAPVEFPDISFYQGTISWDAMSANTKNIIIRAGQNTWVDSAFTDNWRNAKAYALSRGLYWFYDDRVSPQQQFDVLRPLIDHDLPEDRIWIDWEIVYGGNYQGLKNVVALMKLIEQTFPSIIVGMYTGYYFFRDHSNPVNNKAEYDYLSRHPAWIAAYTSDGSSNNVLIPNPPWPVMELHQWGTPSLGKKYGAESIEIDMNRVIHDPQGIYQQGEIMPPTPITKAWFEVVGTDTLNIRNAPGATTAASDIGDLKRLDGDIALCDSTQLVGAVTWYHLIDARKGAAPNGTKVLCTDGKPVAEHTDCWASGAYLHKTDIPVDPNPPEETDQSILQIVKDGVVIFEFKGIQTFPPPVSEL